MAIRLVCFNVRGLMSKEKLNVVKEICKNEEVIYCKKRTGRMR